MTSSLTERKETRRFGAVAFVLFGSLCAFGALRHREVAAIVFGALCALGLLFMALPTALRPVHRAWLKAAHAIGAAVMTVALTFAYYFAVTPFSFAKRVFGGRPLPLKPDKAARSYWAERPEKVQSREQFSKRY